MKNIILPEIVSVGIYNAQKAAKGRMITRNRKTTMFELELSVEDGGISYIDDTFRPITKNLIICAKPGQTRHTRMPFKCYYIHLIVNEGQIFDLLSSLPNYMPPDDSNKLHDLFSCICDNYGAACFEDEIMLQSRILELVSTLGRHAPTLSFQHKPKHNNREVIEKTLRFVNENLTYDLSLAALAERANFSPIYFHKLFKASTGKTVREYVEEQRIKKAIDLLVSTEMTLTHIAYECGFSSQSYFSYAFKRYTGNTPRDFAKTIYQAYEKRLIEKDEDPSP